MAAKLKMDSVSNRQARPQSRRASRIPVHGQIAIRSSHGDSSAATIHDVSTFGCAIECDAVWLRNGMFLTVAPSPDWSIQAVVRWVRSNHAGIEFLRPISEVDALEISGVSARS